MYIYICMYLYIYICMYLYIDLMTFINTPQALNTGKCKLEAFYVLGDTTKTQAGEFANMGCARICIQPVGAEKFIFFIALHHAYTVGIVTTHEQNLSVEMEETDFLATVCFGEHQPVHVHAPTRGEGLCWL